MAEERKPFKAWFDEAAARQLGDQIHNVWPDFDGPRFQALATQNLSALEFNARVKQFSDALRATLPEAIPAALEILTESLPPALPDCE